MSENYRRFPEVTDDVIAISGPCKSKIFELRKIDAVTPQTIPKTLLSSFLVLVRNSCIVIWSNSDISIFEGIGKIHGKTGLRYHYVIDHFRIMLLIFRDMRT